MLSSTLRASKLVELHIPELVETTLSDALRGSSCMDAGSEMN